VAPPISRLRQVAKALPHAGQYDAPAGFLMAMLRRIPKRTDAVEWGGWRFVVVDVDSHRVDQVLITQQAAAG